MNDLVERFPLGSLVQSRLMPRLLGRVIAHKNRWVGLELIVPLNNTTGYHLDGQLPVGHGAWVSDLHCVVLEPPPSLKTRLRHIWEQALQEVVPT